MIYYVDFYWLHYPLLSPIRSKYRGLLVAGDGGLSKESERCFLFLAEEGLPVVIRII